MSIIFGEKSEDKRYACLLQRKLLLVYHVRLCEFTYIRLHHKEEMLQYHSWQ